MIIKIAALNQARIDTTVIIYNLTNTRGTFLLDTSLVFGLGSKEVIRDLVKTFYAKKNYEVGGSILR
jgi:hypothetical protein